MLQEVFQEVHLTVLFWTVGFLIIFTLTNEFFAKVLGRFKTYVED